MDANGILLSYYNGSSYHIIMDANSILDIIEIMIGRK